MTLLQTVKKLRAAAEVLEDLLGLDQPTRQESPATAKRMLKGLKGKLKKHHNGLHWTQRPENKAKLRAMNKKVIAARRAVA